MLNNLINIQSKVSHSVNGYYQTNESVWWNLMEFEGEIEMSCYFLGQIQWWNKGSGWTLFDPLLLNSNKTNHRTLAGKCAHLSEKLWQHHFLPVSCYWFLISSWHFGTTFSCVVISDRFVTFLPSDTNHVVCLIGFVDRNFLHFLWNAPFSSKRIRQRRFQSILKLKFYSFFSKGFEELNGYISFSYKFL